MEAVRRKQLPGADRYRKSLVGNWVLYNVTSSKDQLEEREEIDCFPRREPTHLEG